MKSLQSLRSAGLTHIEAGQLIRRHLTDLATIDPALLTNEPYNLYIQELNTHSVLYEKALAQIQKNKETLVVNLADKDRDKAYSACNRCLALYALSDDPEEVESSRILKIIFRNFKNLPNLNYEAETMATDKLISDLEQPEAAQHVNKLNMEPYVNRLKNKNETFKSLFGSRIQTEALTENYDMKSIRKETFATYRDFCNYVLAMAKAHDTSLFNQALDLINAGRKYYSDRMAS